MIVLTITAFDYNSQLIIVLTESFVFCSFWLWSFKLNHLMIMRNKNESGV